MRKKIVVADDDVAISDVLQQVLEDEGYEVIPMLHGETLLHLREPFPDLLILDLWLAGIDGRTICQKLKNQENTSHIPIIIISALSETERIANKAGADDFLAKPFELDTLLALIEKYLGSGECKPV